MPYTTNVAGTTITAAWGNANVRDQVITPFASASARDAAITSPVAGMYADVADIGVLTRYSGSAWIYPFYHDRNTLSGTAASITFSNIPTHLRTIRLLWSARGDAVLSTIAVSLRVNGDSAGSYAAAFTQVTTQVSDIAQTSMKIGNTWAASGPASQFASGEVNIVGWDSRAKLNPTFTYSATDPASAAAAFYGYGGGLYNTSGPYTSLTILAGSGNFISGSEFLLHGWE
jgi:hypothetical protein